MLAVYIEATAEETEARLLRGLRKACPELPAEPEPGRCHGRAAAGPGAAARARRCCWSSTSSSSGSSPGGARRTPELVAALRQCDGEHVQAIVHGPGRLLDGRDPVHAGPGDRPGPEREHRRWSISSTRGTPARSWRRSAEPTGPCPSAHGDLTTGPGSLPGPGDRRAGPGRQGHLGAAGAVRRDGQGEALGPGDVAGGRRHRGRGRDVPRGDLQPHRRPTPSTACTRRRPRPC